MAPQLRVEYPGALDHFTARGTDQQSIIHAGIDRTDCLTRLGQKILLAASAQGLASYWSSCPKGTNEATAALCGFDAGTTIVAIIYLGWANGAATAPPRPDVTLTIIE